ncbi:MAG: DUF2225 domain-containing protein [Tumebacillaceae bacterium]
MFIGEPLYDRKVTCPLCKANYTTKKVLTKAIRTTRVEGDFYAVYEEVNPIYYHVNVCATCGFSFMEKTEPKIPQYVRDRYKRDVVPRWNPRDYCMGRSIKEAIVAYKLAIFCAQYIEEASRTIGGLCLHLAWLYRELGDPQEYRFLQDALDCYMDAYETDRSIESNGKIAYLLGELSRRLGDAKTAVRFFNIVIQDKKSEPKYVRLARDQWALLREEQMSGAVS